MFTSFSWKIKNNDVFSKKLQRNRKIKFKRTLSNVISSFETSDSLYVTFATTFGYFELPPRNFSTFMFFKWIIDKDNLLATFIKPLSFTGSNLYEQNNYRGCNPFPDILGCPLLLQYQTLNIWLVLTWT